jgi:hypothetical protein
MFLLGSQQTVLEPDLAVKTFARAREFETTLPEPSRTYLHYVNEREAKRLGAILVPYLRQLGADDPRCHRTVPLRFQPRRFTCCTASRTP